MPAANRAAPIGGPASWLSVMNPALTAGVGDGQVVAVHQHRRQRRRRVVGEDLRAWRAVPTPAAPPHRETVGDHQGDEHRQHHGAERVRGDDDPPAVEPVGEHTGVRPNTSGGAQRSSAASETRNGSSVSDATSSGPAATAIPSPRFVVHDERQQPAVARPQPPWDE